RPRLALFTPPSPPPTSPLPLHDALPTSQRKLLADLRRHGARSAAGTIAGRTTATQQFDEDVWTLVTTSTDQTSSSNCCVAVVLPDRKSTRLNSSHVSISYAVFCLKKTTK